MEMRTLPELLTKLAVPPEDHSLGVATPKTNCGVPGRRGRT